MPVFGKSLFEAVLESLDRPEDETEDEVAPFAAVKGFNGGYVGHESGARTDDGADPSLLFDGYPPDPLSAAVTLPVWLLRLSEAEIAEDLALGSCRTEHDLRERRRLFAFENHPDRVPADYRDQATRRMTIANQLVDAALARTVRP
jgi:hypothetical protein